MEPQRLSKQELSGALANAADLNKKVAAGTANEPHEASSELAHDFIRSNSGSYVKNVAEAQQLFDEKLKQHVRNRQEQENLEFELSSTLISATALKVLKKQLARYANQLKLENVRTYGQLVFALGVGVGIPAEEVSNIIVKLENKIGRSSWSQLNRTAKAVVGLLHNDSARDSYLEFVRSVTKSPEGNLPLSSSLTSGKVTPSNGTPGQATQVTQSTTPSPASWEWRDGAAAPYSNDGELIDWASGKVIGEAKSAPKKAVAETLATGKPETPKESVTAQVGTAENPIDLESGSYEQVYLNHADDLSFQKLDLTGHLNAEKSASKDYKASEQEQDFFTLDDTAYVQTPALTAEAVDEIMLGFKSGVVSYPTKAEMSWSQKVKNLLGGKLANALLSYAQKPGSEAILKKYNMRVDPTVFLLANSSVNTIWQAALNSKAKEFKTAILNQEHLTKLRDSAREMQRGFWFMRVELLTSPKRFKHLVESIALANEVDLRDTPVEFRDYIHTLRNQLEKGQLSEMQTFKEWKKSREPQVSRDAKTVKSPKKDHSLDSSQEADRRSHAKSR